MSQAKENATENVTKNGAIDVENAVAERGEKCRVSIFTETDENRFAIVRLGRLLSIGKTIDVSYEEGETAARFFTDGNTARWLRSGEFCADLHFDTNGATTGEFFDGGLSGKAEIETHGISVTEKKDKIFVDLHYTLRFDCGEQRMRVKVLVDLCEKTEDIVS